MKAQDKRLTTISVLLLLGLLVIFLKWHFSPMQETVAKHQRSPRLTVRADAGEGRVSGKFDAGSHTGMAKTSKEQTVSPATATTTLTAEETTSRAPRHADESSSEAMSVPAPVLKVATVSFGQLYDGYGKVLEELARRKAEGPQKRTAEPNTMDVIHLKALQFDRAVLEDIHRAVARIAQAEGIDLVFDTSGRSIVGVEEGDKEGQIIFGLNSSGRLTTDLGILPFANPSLDLTAKVLEEMNREFSPVDGADQGGK